MAQQTVRNRNQCEYIKHFIFWKARMILRVAELASPNQILVFIMSYFIFNVFVILADTHFVPYEYKPKKK